LDVVERYAASTSRSVWIAEFELDAQKGRLALLKSMSPPEQSSNRETLEELRNKCSVLEWQLGQLVAAATTRQVQLSDAIVASDKSWARLAQLRMAASSAARQRRHLAMELAATVTEHSVLVASIEALKTSIGSPLSLSDQSITDKDTPPPPPISGEVAAEVASIALESAEAIDILARYVDAARTNAELLTRYAQERERVAADKEAERTLVVRQLAAATADLASSSGVATERKAVVGTLSAEADRISVGLAARNRALERVDSSSPAAAGLKMAIDAAMQRQQVLVSDWSRADSQAVAADRVAVRAKMQAAAQAETVSSLSSSIDKARQEATQLRQQVNATAVQLAACERALSLGKRAVQRASGSAAPEGGDRHEALREQVIRVQSQIQASTAAAAEATADRLSLEAKMRGLEEMREGLETQRRLAQRQSVLLQPHITAALHLSPSHLPPPSPQHEQLTQWRRDQSHNNAARNELLHRLDENMAEAEGVRSRLAEAKEREREHQSALIELRRSLLHTITRLQLTETAAPFSSAHAAAGIVGQRLESGVGSGQTPELDQVQSTLDQLKTLLSGSGELVDVAGRHRAWVQEDAAMRRPALSLIDGLLQAHTALLDCLQSGCSPMSAIKLQRMTVEGHDLLERIRCGDDTVSPVGCSFFVSKLAEVKRQLQTATEQTPSS